MYIQELLILKCVMLAMFIIIDIYSLHYDIMKRHICQCVCPEYPPPVPQRFCKQQKYQQRFERSPQIGICGGGTLSKHGTSVPIKCTVISGLKSRAPITININLSSAFFKLWTTCTHMCCIAHVSQRLRENSPERYKGKEFNEKIRSRLSPASPSAVSMYW